VTGLKRVEVNERWCVVDGVKFAWEFFGLMAEAKGELYRIARVDDVVHLAPEDEGTTKEERDGTETDAVQGNTRG
jgi:hypothetical protein